jgi:hypothetical protein
MNRCYSEKNTLLLLLVEVEARQFKFVCRYNMSEMCPYSWYTDGKLVIINDVGNYSDALYFSSHLIIEYSFKFIKI